MPVFRLIVALAFLFFFSQNSLAQTWSRADTLRGKLRHERTCYDVGHYDLSVKLDIPNKSIQGKSIITYQIKENFQRLQVDLFANMVIDDIIFKGQSLAYERIDNAVFISFPKVQTIQDGVGQIAITYHGQPHTAKNPPWDGGFTWTQDPSGHDWVVVSCEGIGASLWWPNKDHLSDEPDSVDIHLNVPSNLMAVSNGNLVHTKTKNKRSIFHWKVSYPINNYNITLNVGKYAHFAKAYISETDTMSLDYYVLPENLNKAKKHFEIVPQMLEIYEFYLGKFPFWKDGYALVETPTLGMEHQGAISYGNKYLRGYLGKRIPKDMNWDYIIIHESAHEYWGNSVSCNDLAEMWLHEGFTTYMESLYVEKRFGHKRAQEYLKSQRDYIQNLGPIIGIKDVNHKPMFSTDQYYKGSWMLHTLRNTIGDDHLWFDILKTFYQRHALSNVTTLDFIKLVNERTKQDYRPFFEQYLLHAHLPKLIYYTTKKGRKTIFHYRWQADVKNFRMPISLAFGQKQFTLPGSPEWQTISLGKGKNQVDINNEDFLILVKKKRFFRE